MGVSLCIPRDARCFLFPHISPVTSGRMQHRCSFIASVLFHCICTLSLHLCSFPPKNGVIALWPNTRVVKCKYYFSQKQSLFNNKSTGTAFNSLLYLNSRQGFNGLKYMYSVILVIVNSLPGNTKNRESTRSWTARVRLVHSWAALHRCSFIASLLIHGIFALSWHLCSFRKCAL